MSAAAHQPGRRARVARRARAGDQASATLLHAAPGRNWNGQVYVATPALLRSFGIRPAQVRADADVLTMRPGLPGLSKMELLYGQTKNLGGATSFPCPAGSCLAGPVIQGVSALPSGTSAPNTVITEHAVTGSVCRRTWPAG